jgi:hypothetical protein
MPFDGQPSRGCQQCRHRRVKCDQTVPACQRCCRANRVCSGYQARTDLVFRDMNHVTETKVKKRMRPIAGLGESLTPERDSRVQAAEKTLRENIKFVYRSEAYVAPSVIPGWEEVAVTRFFADYTVSSDKFLDCLHFLPGLCRRLSDSSLLKEALHAVAFRSQGNQGGMEWMVIEGSLSYSRALLLLAEVSEEHAISDPVLAAVYLIGIYEVRYLVFLLSRPLENEEAHDLKQVVSGQHEPDALFPLHHHYGRSLLLQLRGYNQFGNDIQNSLFRTSLALLVSIKCLTAINFKFVHVYHTDSASRS